LSAVAWLNKRYRPLYGYFSGVIYVVFFATQTFDFGVGWASFIRIVVGAIC
jgi:hypothetical protein